MKIREKYIGDRQFYRMILLIALPILLQNGITNFVNLLDNIMVGQLGTEQMTGVAIVNQLIMVFQLSIFGAVSGASIFSAQFFGQGNHEGVRYTFRFKLISCTVITLVWIAILYFAKDSLINLYLNDIGSADVETTFNAGRIYLSVMLAGLLPYTFTQVYSSTLRETGETLRPMMAGIAAVVVNLVFNYLLIFGHFGFPELGIEGAAIATVMSRFVELAIVVLWTHVHESKYRFIHGVYTSLYVPMSLVKQIIAKGMPLFINEFLWSAGQAVLVQCYSTRGLNAIAALNISTTVSNLFNVVFIALGSSISIVVGQLLGANELEKAIDTDRKMVFFSVTSCFFVGAILCALAPLFPMIYNTTDEVRYLASWLIRISAIYMPLNAFYHAAYFTLRTGGKTVITFLFDSCYVWAVNIPFTFVLSHFTGLPLLAIYPICQSVEIFKGILGAVLLKKKIWVNKIV